MDRLRCKSRKLCHGRKVGEDWGKVLPWGHSSFTGVILSLLLDICRSPDKSSLGNGDANLKAVPWKKGGRGLEQSIALRPLLLGHSQPHTFQSPKMPKNGCQTNLRRKEFNMCKNYAQKLVQILFWLSNLWGHYYLGHSQPHTFQSPEMPKKWVSNQIMPK